MIEYPKSDYFGDLLAFPLALGGVNINHIKSRCLFVYTASVSIHNDAGIKLINSFSDYEHVFLHDFFHYNHNHIENCVSLKRTLSHPSIKIISATPHRDVYIHDFLWNLTKAYYTESYHDLLARIPNHQAWHFEKNAYVQPTTLGQGSKIFLSVNRVYESNTHRIRRAQLIKVLENYEHLGYLGKTFIKSVTGGPDIIVQGSVVIPPEVPGVGELGNNFGPFNPVKQEIYNDTYLSIYVESLEKGMVAPTEKTYFPLVKGHFILPFSGPYMIKQLRHQGWKLPNFIDYSYDQIENDDDRWNAYTKEVQRLLTFPVSFYKEKAAEHANDLWHNVNMVHTKPYYSLLPLFKKFI